MVVECDEDEEKQKEKKIGEFSGERVRKLRFYAGKKLRACEEEITFERRSGSVSRERERVREREEKNDEEENFSRRRAIWRIIS